MATMGFADDSEEVRGSCRLVCVGVPVCHGKIILCFPLLFKSFCIWILLNLEVEF